MIFQTVKSTYLQTCPQIWSSNFTVLALALEKYEDTRVRVICFKIKISKTAPNSKTGRKTKKLRVEFRLVDVTLNELLRDY